MKKGSVVKLKEDYMTLTETNVFHTYLGSIILKKGKTGTVVKKGIKIEGSWVVRFPIVDKIELEVDVEGCFITVCRAGVAGVKG